MGLINELKWYFLRTTGSADEARVDKYRQKIRDCTTFLILSYLKFKETHTNCDPRTVINHLIEQHIERGVHCDEADRALAYKKLLDLKKLIEHEHDRFEKLSEEDQLKGFIQAIASKEFAEACPNLKINVGFRSDPEIPFSRLEYREMPASEYDPGSGENVHLLWLISREVSECYGELALVDQRLPSTKVRIVWKE